MDVIQYVYSDHKGCLCVSLNCHLVFRLVCFCALLFSVWSSWHTVIESYLLCRKKVLHLACSLPTVFIQFCHFPSFFVRMLPNPRPHLFVDLSSVFTCQQHPAMCVCFSPVCTQWSLHC